jgi:hypothetical protein
MLENEATHFPVGLGHIGKQRGVTMMAWSCNQSHSILRTLALSLRTATLVMAFERVLCSHLQSPLVL